MTSPAHSSPSAGAETGVETEVEAAVETGTCESCGAPADDVAPVHRVYVTPGGWDLSAPEERGDDEVQVLDEVERWCFPCRSQYPHQPLGT